MMAEAEGKRFHFVGVEYIKPEYIEVFEFDSPDQEIVIETTEFSAVCPFSGLPDIADIQITYRPVSNLCIELKALKYYFTSFRNVGIYQEAVTKRIYEDLREALQINSPDLCVMTRYNTRGGLDVVCREGGME